MNEAIDELINEIQKAITYINRYCNNDFIKNRCRILKEKLVSVSERQYHELPSLETACQAMHLDTNMIERVTDVSEKVYAKAKELDGLIDQIPEKYFG